MVAYRNGSPVRLEELGNVIDSVEDDKTASWFYTPQGQQRAIVLAIQRQPGTNTIEVTDGVKNLLPVFRAELPPSVHMDILYDRSDTIRESYTDVQFTMLLTLGLVVMVIFLFLRNVSATMIPSLALPFSIIGTFAVMYLLNYSLDNLSMMALILSIGFVVDDAIVMLENIVRHMEMGEKPLEAALEGLERNRLHHRLHDAVAGGRVHPGAVHGRHPGPAVPEFAVTICVAILISGVVSVTLTPMLCSRFLRAAHEEQARLVLPHHRAVLRRHAARLRPHAASGAAPPRRPPWRFRRWCWPPPCTCSSRFPRASSRTRTPTSCSVDHRGRAGHFVLPDGGVSEQQVAEIVRAGSRTWRRSMSSVGGTTASNLGGPNYGAAGGAPEAAQPAQAELVERHHRGAAAQARRTSPA